MTYYEELTKEVFRTTAIYPNRIKDKAELESLSDLKEDGRPDIEFLTKDKKIPLAHGYIRIVYGDHSPYIELLKDQIYWKFWNCVRLDIGYYNIWNPIDGSNVTLYDQRVLVTNLKNPPKGPRSFKGNRKEGYADYRVDRLYDPVSEKTHGFSRGMKAN
jgi:hypothetical protein